MIKTIISIATNNNLKKVVKMFNYYFRLKSSKVMKKYNK